MPGRQGLIKKRIVAMRKGKPVQTTVWVRPQEAAAARKMKRQDPLQRMKQAKAKAQTGSSETKEPPEDRKKRLTAESPESRIARREKVMTKYRRQAPGRGHESKPTKQEVIDILETGRFALVSAGKNPNLEADMSNEAQAERHEQLKKQLVADGYQFTPVDGKYGEEENSFLVWVHDATREDSIKLGEDYNQDSVIYGENGVYESHFTNDAPPSEWDPRGHKSGEVEVVETETWNDQTDEDDYYTKVPLADGTFFKFNLPLYQELGEPVSPYKRGSRREFLHGVDDIEQQEIMERLAKRKKRRRA